MRAAAAVVVALLVGLCSPSLPGAVAEEIGALAAVEVGGGEGRGESAGTHQKGGAQRSGPLHDDTIGTSSSSATGTQRQAATCPHDDSAGSCSSAAGTAEKAREEEAAASEHAVPALGGRSGEGRPPHDDAGGGAGGAVTVETGERDGVRIEYVGTAEGTIPNSDSSPKSPPASPPAQPSSLPPDDGRREAPLGQQRAGRGEGEGEGWSSAEAGFELVACEGERYRQEAPEDASLTVKGVFDHMVGKLYESVQKTADAAGKDASFSVGETLAGAGADADAYRALGNPYWEKALEVALAPAGYLFGTVGSMPGWISDAVFTVSLKDSAPEKDLPQRLVLVQDHPLSLQLVCSALAPFPAPPGPEAVPGWWTIPRLVRRVCLVAPPFPGKKISRPCRVGVARPTGWVDNATQTGLAWLGLGDGGVGVGSTECVCAAGGRGPCEIRSPPGRDPCLYLEAGDVSKRVRNGQGVSAERKGGGVFGADSVDAFSVVEFPTQSVAIPALSAAFSRGDFDGEKSVGGKDTAGGGGGAPVPAAQTVAALKATMAEKLEHGLPSSVNVPVYAAQLLVGAFLLACARPLSESRTFHYSLSALLGALIGMVGLVLRTLGKPRRTFFRLFMLAGVVFWLVAALGGDFIPSPAEVLSGLPGAMLAFWRYGLASYPWAGKAFFAASGLAGVLITRWQGLFLDEGDGPRGSWFNGQACIRRVLTGWGLLHVYNGVSDAEVGKALVLLALLAPSLAHCARRFNMWCNRSRCYRAGRQLTQCEYEQEGDDYTRKALEELRATTSDNLLLMKKLKNQASRKRMYAFTRSGEHCAPPAEDANVGGWCSIQ